MNQKSKTPLLRLAICVTYLLVLPHTAHTQNSYKIQGAVLDKDNNPIAGVLVTIYRGSRPISRDTTRQDGSYSISFPIGPPITTTRYDHSAWNLTVINSISGMRDHTINKVLNEIGTDLSYAEKQELLFSLERVYDIDRANDISDAEFQAKYSLTIEKAGIKNEVQAMLKENELNNIRELMLPGNYTLVSITKVSFRPGSSRLTEEAMEKLDSFATQLTNNRSFILEIIGYPDTKSATRINQQLAEMRANTVERYLVEKHNVPMMYMFARNFSSPSPRIQNVTNQDKFPSQNSRTVEIWLLRKRRN